jgi:emfourin
VRIELHRHGGLAAIPGNGLRIEVDTGTLADEVAERVAAAVRRADPERLAAREPSARAGGDRRIYDLTLTDEGGRREFRFVEPLDPALRDLVALLPSVEAP